MSIDAVPEIEYRDVIKQIPEVEAQFVEKQVNTQRRRSKWRQRQGRWKGVRFGHSPDQQVADERHEAQCEPPVTMRCFSRQDPVNELFRCAVKQTQSKASARLRGAKDLMMVLTKETVSGP